MKEIIKNKGFTLIELIVVIGILSILAGISFPQLQKYHREYKFWDYASQMEYLVKQAKIYAMERTVNVGVCVNSANKTLTIRNLGTDRGAGICNGTAIKSMTVIENYITLNGTGGSFDPRGIAIQIGSTCVSYSGKFVKMNIHRVGIRKDTGFGNCQ